MRIVFSRKGFDSQYGRVPSPIFPDGTFASVPIPSQYGRPFREMGGMTPPLCDVLRDLSGYAIDSSMSVHVDPDLSHAVLKRPLGWRPAFGQVGAAQGHLSRQGVGPDDVFIFFGWFRRVEREGGRWRYVPGAPSIHSVFGWLQVAEVLAIEGDGFEVLRRFPWLGEHPHLRHAAEFAGQRNTVYVASDSLHIGGRRLAVAGGGAFPCWGPSLQLSANGSSRSLWKVPGWMYPTAGRPALTYHSNAERWRRDGNDVLLQTVAKGQEFVLDTSSYPEAQPWLEHLLTQTV